MSISVIVPVYNESESIEVFLDRIIPVLKKNRGRLRDNIYLRSLE